MMRAEGFIGRPKREHGRFALSALCLTVRFLAPRPAVQGRVLVHGPEQRSTGSDQKADPQRDARAAPKP